MTGFGDPLQQFGGIVFKDRALIEALPVSLGRNNTGRANHSLRHILTRVRKVRNLRAKCNKEAGMCLSASAQIIAWHRCNRPSPHWRVTPLIGVSTASTEKLCASIMRSHICMGGWRHRNRTAKIVFVCERRKRPGLIGVSGRSSNSILPDTVRLERKSCPRLRKWLHCAKV